MCSLRIRAHLEASEVVTCCSKYKERELVDGQGLTVKQVASGADCFHTFFNPNRRTFVADLL